MKTVIGDCTLILADAREVEPMACDMILCDAPYLVESGGNTTGEMGGKFSKDVYDNSGSIVECDISWSEIFEVFSNMLQGATASHIYCMANNRNVYDAWSAALEYQFHFHNLLVWNKQIATPNRWYMKNLEFILMFKKGPAFHINDCGQKQLFNFPCKPETKHPTEKPVELMANFIRQSTKRGQIVCDPFMGTGATIVAAVREGRKAVGIEIDADHYTVACKRIEDALSNKQESMFA